MSDGTGVGPLHRDVFALPFFFSVLLAFLGADVFFPKGTSMPGFEKNYRSDCSAPPYRC